MEQEKRDRPQILRPGEKAKFIPPSRSNAFVTLEKPVVEEDAAFLAEQELALLLDAHNGPFDLAQLQRVRLGERLIEQAHVVFDLLTVDSDAEFSEQLVEVEFDHVTFQFPDFQTEFHNS